MISFNKDTNYTPATFGNLPEEVSFKIFSYLNSDDLEQCQLVSKEWNRIASDQKLWETPPKGAFGKEQWEKYFGDVGEVPLLPKKIYKIFKEKMHMLVLIPKTINGEPLTLVKLERLVKALKKDQGGHATKYRYIWDAIIQEHGHQATAESHWVMMTKDVIEGSRNKSYKDQQDLIAALNTQTGMNDEMPNVLDAITCIFMHYVSSGERLFNDNPWTYTRCQEKARGYQIIVGGFSPTGLGVGYYDLVPNRIGAAAARKFF